MSFLYLPDCQFSHFLIKLQSVVDVTSFSFGNNIILSVATMLIDEN